MPSHLIERMYKYNAIILRAKITTVVPNYPPMQSLLVSVVDIIDIESSVSHTDVIVYRTPCTL